ncbi:hypothetical protein PQU92_03635 [Asticcacaulis sp. BYS171W]|uniref:Homogentisate 1,2-dioxygenase n=1 Tax=Asticcacaulis aquaticus TaxID=2984212 RepID=A0ABT5HQM4_9CAUL|nr:hypothetical protein [Asticcacaulis aquaticus]MDC7682351.1 hypothetical protein [Asticcacaulis aquaticus]
MRALLTAALVLVAAPVFAQDAAPKTEKPVCPTTPAMTGEFAHWMHAGPVTATVDAKGAPLLKVGTPLKVTLLDSTRVTYKRARATQPTTPVYSGTLSLKIDTAGQYGIAAGAGVWIDVEKDGKTLSSNKHGHGPDCSGVRKIVEFALEPGTYTVHLVDNKEPTITVMAVSR